MKRYSIHATVMLLCLMLTVASSVSADRLTVVASVFPLYDFAREVAGSAADVRILLPAGVDPHSWEPKPSDIADLSRADIFLYTSGRMEPWTDSIANAVRERDILIVEVLDALGLFNSGGNHGSGETVFDSVHGGGKDPHFWLDLSLSARAVELIGELFADSDPANGTLYRSNAGHYIRLILELDTAFLNGLKDCGSRQLVTGGHAAFGYLTRRYNLEQVSVYGLTADTEPSPRHLARIVEVVKDNNIQTVFSEELMNPKMAEVLSQETGARILALNPAGNLTATLWREGVTFLEIMKSNLETIREGLNCE